MRRLAALILLLALALAPLRSQSPALGPRVAAAEAVVAQHYRGEPLEAARDRVVAEIAAFNREAAAAQTAQAGAKTELDARLEALRSLETRIAELDRALSKLPTGGDDADEARHAARLKERRALAARHREGREAADPQVTAYNARVAASNEALTARRTAVLEAQKQVNARIDAFEAFRRNGGDAAFYAGLSRLLGEALRGADLTAAARVRALRRELMAWARAKAATQPFGPVLVEARIQGEPCCLMVDTGAMRTSLAPELAEALGLDGRLGEEATFVLAGGVRLRGRTVDLPDLSVAGATARAVPAVLISATEVGIDGLLGQSFLKGFVYTVDERTPEKLKLTPR